MKKNRYPYSIVGLISPEQKVLVDEELAKREISTSEFIRELVEAYFDSKK